MAASGEVSQGELAREAGLSRVTLGAVERGEHAARSVTYRRIAVTLGLSFDELFAEVGK